jgi:DNA repair exonuclease SbcCD ATPase subunit
MRGRSGKGDVQTVRRLAREVDLLEASLMAAERAAISCRSARSDSTQGSNDHIASRREELERRELALRQRERSLDDQSRLLSDAQHRLARIKDSLKRAIRRFRCHIAQQSETLREREQRVGVARAELIENRRALAREGMRLKVANRGLSRGH